MYKNKITEIDNLISEEYGNTAGIKVLKNGETCYESYFNGCDNASCIHVFSVTKSVLSVLLGIAIDKGFIKNTDQRVLDFFPEHQADDKNDAIQHITLKHLMTMTAPYQFDAEPYEKYFSSEDWVSFALGLLGGESQTGQFRYTPLIGPDILSGILVQATGQSVLDFAKENLFSPLGIQVADNIVFRNEEEQWAFYESTSASGWVADRKGTNSAGWGLTLTAGDMAKLGQLYLNAGVWEGKQMISKEWVRESTAKHSVWEAMKISYGYLWWVIDEDAGSFAAMGDGGNVIYANPKKNLAVAVASLFDRDAKDRIQLILEHVEPAFG